MGGVAEASTEYWYFHSFTGNKWRGCVWWMVVHKARGFSVKFRSAGSGSLAVNFVIGFFFCQFGSLFFNGTPIFGLSGTRQINVGVADGMMMLFRPRQTDRFVTHWGFFIINNNNNSWQLLQLSILHSQRIVTSSSLSSQLLHPQ